MVFKLCANLSSNFFKCGNRQMFKFIYVNVQVYLYEFGGWWLIAVPTHSFKSWLLTRVIVESRKYFVLYILLIFSLGFDIEYSSLNSLFHEFLLLYSPGFPTALANFQSHSWIPSLSSFFLNTHPEFLFVAVVFRTTLLNSQFRPIYQFWFYFWLLANHSYLWSSEICENSMWQKETHSSVLPLMFFVSWIASTSTQSSWKRESPLSFLHNSVSYEVRQLNFLNIFWIHLLCS